MLIMNKQELIQHPGQFDNFWSIMEISFPWNERKTKEEYFKQLDEKLFEIELFPDNSNNITGFIAWWQLEKYIFIEHFAVASIYRNKGLGKKYFFDFINSANYPVVLEVEPPTDEISKRRIIFYEQLGFTLYSYPYYQPSYHNNNESVEMFLMTNCRGFNRNDFDLLRRDIYKNVYQYQIYSE
jgi:ribosomal protein S18 acetylase RimI-like enzyme